MNAQENREPLGDEQIESARDRAKAIYLTMPIVRHLEVAQQCGVPLESIKRWHVEDNWLELRAAFQAKKTGRLKELLGDPIDVAEKYAALCNQIISELQAQFERRRHGAQGADNTYRISKALAATYELHIQILRDTNVIKAKKEKRRRKKTRQSK
ncbi:MAG: hypothetical protein K2Y39_04905 [Candidatus Obscuribacterales bacterium]|nr:hypothetical protein [Candidatus Obscuribacterales bacterium]